MCPTKAYTFYSSTLTLNVINTMTCFIARSQSKNTSRFSCPALALPAAYDQPELYNFVHITKDMNQAQGCMTF